MVVDFPSCYIILYKVVEHCEFTSLSKPLLVYCYPSSFMSLTKFSRSIKVYSIKALSYSALYTSIFFDNYWFYNQPSIMFIDNDIFVDDTTNKLFINAVSKSLYLVIQN